jgi:hypothetical protein
MKLPIPAGRKIREYTPLKAIVIKFQHDSLENVFILLFFFCKFDQRVP